MVGMFVPGEKAVASYDKDCVTMAVVAKRRQTFIAR
jgi:hypothetical protein